MKQYLNQNLIENVGQGMSLKIKFKSNLKGQLDKTLF